MDSSQATPESGLNTVPKTLCQNQRMAETGYRKTSNMTRSLRRLKVNGQALGDWGDARGYEAEVVWDKCTTAALNLPYEKARWREVRTLSGGEQKRLVLEALLLGSAGVLLLDEPDNYLDVPGKQWLEEQLCESGNCAARLGHPRSHCRSSVGTCMTTSAGRSPTISAGQCEIHS